jgi:hypothetical protein
MARDDLNLHGEGGWRASVLPGTRPIPSGTPEEKRYGVMAIFNTPSRRLAKRS